MWCWLSVFGCWSVVAYCDWMVNNVVISRYLQWFGGLVVWYVRYWFDWVFIFVLTFGLGLFTTAVLTSCL